MAQYENIRRIYMDLDDVVFNSSPLIQHYVEKNFPQFSSKILRLKEGNLFLWNNCLKMARLEIAKAEEEGREPNLVLPFPVGKNDIIREVQDQNEDYDFYNQKSIIELGKYIELAKHEKDMFLEERDATLEADGKLENGVIPYEIIYSEENWMPYARENMNNLYNVFGERLVCLTAHNGIDDNHGREYEAKADAIHRINPNIKVYGVRFHPYEHQNNGKRRPRTLKSSAIRKIEGIGPYEDIRFIVCPDDSSFNNNDIYDNGGIPIFINRYGAENEKGFAMAKSIRAESLFREFDALNLNGNKKQVLRKVLKR